MNSKLSWVVGLGLVTLVSCGQAPDEQSAPLAIPTTVIGSQRPTDSTAPTTQPQSTPAVRDVEIQEASDLLPPLDLLGIASAGVKLESDGLTISSAAGLSPEESPVGNDICLIVSTAGIESGRICASTSDVGGLLAFSQDHPGGVAVAALTSTGVQVEVEGCISKPVSHTTDLGTLTLCGSVTPGASTAAFLLDIGGDTVRVTMPVTATDK